MGRSSQAACDCSTSPSAPATTDGGSNTRPGNHRALMSLKSWDTQLPCSHNTRVSSRWTTQPPTDYIHLDNRRGIPCCDFHSTRPSSSWTKSSSNCRMRHHNQTRLLSTPWHGSGSTRSSWLPTRPPPDWRMRHRNRTHRWCSHVPLRHTARRKENPTTRSSWHQKQGK